MRLNAASAFFVVVFFAMPIGDVADMHGDVILGDRRLTFLDPCGIELRTDGRGRSGDDAAHMQRHGEAEGYSCRHAV